MRSSRLTRGTSVIAAIIFAALLGAVALGLNAVQSNSANSAALPADATAAATTPAANSSSPQIPQCSTINIKTNATVDLNDTTKGACVCSSELSGKTYYYQLLYSQIKGVSGGQVSSIRQLVQGQGSVGEGPTPPNVKCEVNECPASQLDNPVNQTNGNAAGCTAPTTGANPLVANSSTGATVAADNSVCNQSSSSYNATQCAQVQAMSNPAAQGNTGTNSVCNPASSYFNSAQCAQSQAMSSPDAQGNPGSSGLVPQTINCTSNPSMCPDNQTPEQAANDPNTYCYGNNGNNTTCFPPAGQNTMAGYSCSPNAQDNNVVTCTQTAANGNGTANNGTANNGTANNGTANNGTANNGTANNGTANNGTANNGNGNANNSGLNGISSLLAGLARGLAGSTCTATAQSPYVGGNGYTLVPTQVYNPTTGTYSTQYVQQPTASTGVTPTGQPCTPAQQAQTCPTTPTPPTCAANSTPQPIYSGSCIASYQCVNANGSTLGSSPTPQLSCSPQIADVNESVAISYSCQNATGSSGSGFTTGNQLSGSASATITAPPSGTNTATYGLTCTNNGQSANTSCSVQVNQPSIDLVADPQAVPEGQTSTIGWITQGMQSCVISSPEDSTFTSANASDQNTSGSAPTDPITSSTSYTLTCQSLGGETKTAQTTVNVGTGTSTPDNITINSSVDGASANHGGTVTINWQSTSTPSGSAVSLWLIDVQSEEATALIAGDQSVNGSYEWQIPAAGSTCDQSSGGIDPCATDLVAGDSYGIEAAVYTPSDAYLGGIPEPTNPVNPDYSAYAYTASPFVVGQ